MASSVPASPLSDLFIAVAAAATAAATATPVDDDDNDGDDDVARPARSLRRYTILIVGADACTGVGRTNPGNSGDVPVPPPELPKRGGSPTDASPAAATGAAADSRRRPAARSHEAVEDTRAAR